MNIIFGSGNHLKFMVLMPGVGRFRTQIAAEVFPRQPLD
jgi:hypothetical protein